MHFLKVMGKFVLLHVCMCDYVSSEINILQICTNSWYANRASSNCWYLCYSAPLKFRHVHGLKGSYDCHMHNAHSRMEGVVKVQCKGIAISANNASR